jgi:hypothetical protein
MLDPHCGRLSGIQPLQLSLRSLPCICQTMMTEDASFVIDNGAAGFVRLGSYLVETEFSDLLAQYNRDLLVHAVVAGGDMALKCPAGLDTVLSAFPPSVKVVIWLNEHSGPVEVDGKVFEDWKGYTDNIRRIPGLVRLRRSSVPPLPAGLRRDASAPPDLRRGNRVTGLLHHEQAAAGADQARHLAAVGGDLMSGSQRGNTARVAFRVFQATIERELNEGHTAKTIYERYPDQPASISYTQFVRYIRELPTKETKTALPTPGRHALTHKEFARHASLLAAYAATWAADASLAEDTEKPFSSEELARFVAQIRETLDSMEARAR